MKFHLIQPGMIGRKSDIEKGMAGQNKELYQRYLEEIRGYIRLADELGYASYGHNEHHLQIEGFEITNHPGMFSLFVGLHSKRMRVSTLGYVLPTHNPVRAAEEDRHPRSHAEGSAERRLHPRLSEPMGGLLRRRSRRQCHDTRTGQGPRRRRHDEPRDLRGVVEDREDGVAQLDVQLRGQVLAVPPEERP